MKQQQVCTLKEQEALQETKTSNRVSSETLVSVELEVDDAIYLEHSSDNEYMRGKTSHQKSKIVQRKNSMDETPVRMTSSRTAQITRNREQC